MKKIIVVAIILIVILIIGIGVLILHKAEEESIRKDLASIILKEDMTVEFGKEVKVSDFIENINGNLINDYKIDTENLGEMKVEFEFKNIKNKKRKSEFIVNVVDKTPPKIFSGSSYSVEVGYNKNLADVLLSADDIDDNPKREILGEYDFNTIGNYNLKYVVTDSSGNIAEKEFVLYVKEKSTRKPAPSEKLDISEVVTNYKNEKTKIGVDVSKWQGDVNWQEVKNSGIEFAMMRMGYQTEFDGECVLDPYFDANIKGAKAAGLPVGVYFHSYSKNVNQAVEQAKWVEEKLKGYEIDLYVAFDWESWSSFNTLGMSLYTINKSANSFLNILEEAGYKGMLYSSKTYLDKIWYPSKYDVWLAQYNDKATYDGEYLIWQMSNIGKVNGIKGDVDIDIMYLKENAE